MSTVLSDRNKRRSEATPSRASKKQRSAEANVTPSNKLVADVQPQPSVKSLTCEAFLGCRARLGLITDEKLLYNYAVQYWALINAHQVAKNTLKTSEAADYVPHNIKSGTTLTGSDIIKSGNEFKSLETRLQAAMENYQSSCRKIFIDRNKLEVQARSEETNTFIVSFVKYLLHYYAVELSVDIPPTELNIVIYKIINDYHNALKDSTDYFGVELNEGDQRTTLLKRLLNVQGNENCTLNEETFNRLGENINTTVKLSIIAANEAFQIARELKLKRHKINVIHTKNFVTEQADQVMEVLAETTANQDTITTILHKEINSKVIPRIEKIMDKKLKKSKQSPKKVNIQPKNPKSGAQPDIKSILKQKGGATINTQISKNEDSKKDNKNRNNKNKTKKPKKSVKISKTVTKK